MRTTAKQTSSFDYHTDIFTKDEQQFLDRWLSSYIELEGGRAPTRKTEEHILDMLEGRYPIDTRGMETYIKWQAATNERENSDNQTPNDGGDDNSNNQAPGSGGVLSELTLTLSVATEHFVDLKARATADASALLAVMLATDLSRSVSAWTERIFEGAPTYIDKFIDAPYNLTREGGPLHRLFDGNHTIGGMAEAVKDASPNDTLAQEVSGFMDAFLKDVSTVNGLPFITISPETHNDLANTLSKSLGIPKAWTPDLLSFNMEELIGTSLGVIALAMNWNKADREQFADYAVSLGIAAGFSANPLLGVVALVGLAKALKGKKDKIAYTELLKGVGRGGIGTGLILTAASVIGGPAWIGVIVGLILSVYARRTLGDVSAEYMAKWMSSVLSAANTNVKEGIQSVRGVFPIFNPG